MRALARPCEHALLLALLLPPLLLGSAPAGAFKISTHVWVADHIIAELGSGTELTLTDFEGKIFERVELPPRVAASIRQYPETFRIAVTGADIYPDLVAGQMTTHPGLPFKKNMSAVSEDVIALRTVLGLPAMDSAPGWQTDDWLLHVRKMAYRLSPAGQQPTPQIAFAYGYLLHAAMDTWAHSYVNLMTGDLFSIVDNPTIAARHTALESFFKLVHKKPKLGTKPIAAPAWFVRRTLILNAQAAEQYSRSEAASHLYAMYAWWAKATQLRGQLGRIRSEIDRVAAPALTALEEADALWRTLSEQRDTAVEAAGLALGGLNTAESKLQSAINAVQTAANNATEFLMAIPGLAQLLAAADGAIDGFLSQLSPPLRNAYNTAKTAQAAAQTAVDNAQRELDRARRDRDALIEDVAVAAGDLDLKRAAFEMLDGLRNGAWATADAAFGGWVANIEAAVDAYVLAFEETGRRIMQPQKTRFQQQQGNLEPVRRWAACWGPAFGLPLIPQLHSSCDLSLARYNDLRAAATALKNNLLVPEQFPALRALVLAYDEAVQEATADGLALVGGMVGRAVPTAAGGDIGSGVVAFASTMWDHDVQPADLEQLYSEDGSRVGLPRFSSGQLLTVLSEDGLPMRWQTDGRSGRQRLDAHAASFDEMMQFKPFANAVNLSKLALLGGAELNRLATERRRNAPGYLPNRSYRRFYHPNEQAGAILLGAIRSIDGNHQWQAIAPELPQAASNLSKRSTSTTCQRFGYRPGGQGYPSPAQLAAIVDPDDGVPYCEKDDSGFAAERTELPARKRGMHFWNDPMLRRTIFNCVFKGPLSDGICGVLDNEQALLRHGCSGEPFPPSLGSVSTAGPYCLLQPVAMSKQPPRIPMSGEKTSQTTRPVERRTDQVGKSRPAATGTGSSRDSRKAAAVDRKAAAPRSQQKSSRQAGPAAKSQRERLQDSGRPAAEQQDREARQRATERQVKTLAAEAQAAEAKPAGEHTTTVKTTAGEAPAAERVEQKPAAEEAIRKQPAADAAARRKQEALRDPRIKSGTPGGRPPRD